MLTNCLYNLRNSSSHTHAADHFGQGSVCVFPDTLQNGSEQERGVKACQADKEEVEAVPHLLPGDDDAGDGVADDPEDG